MWIIDDEFDASLPLPDRRARHPADARRPLVRQAQPAHRPVRPRRPRPQRRRHRLDRARQRRQPASPRRQRHAPPPAAAQRLQLHRLRPRAVERRADDPDRDRERADAAGAQAPPHPARPRRARRGGRRLPPLHGRARRAAERAPQGQGRLARSADLQRAADAVPRRQARAGLHERPASAAPPPLLGRRRRAQPPAQLGHLDQLRAPPDLADQRQDLRPLARRRRPPSSTQPSPGSCATAPPSRT